MLESITLIIAYSLFGVGLLAVLASLFPIPYRQPIQVIGVIALALSIYRYGVIQEREEWSLRVSEANTRIAELETQAQKVTIKTIIEYVDRIKIVKEKGDAIIVKVPVYINKRADDGCTINDGFVVLHDAAAKNEVPESPRDSHENASDITLSTVGETIARNYQTYHEIREQLESLQQWVREQEKLHE